MTTTLPPYAYCLGARSSRQAGVAFQLLAANQVGLVALDGTKFALDGR